MTSRLPAYAALLSATALLSLSAGSAIAADPSASGAAIAAAPAADAPAADAADGADGGGEVLVTARRRTESAQNVPIAISVLGGASLASKQALNLQAAYQEVPSLTVYTLNPRNVTVNIRGLGTNIATPNIGLDLGVGFYIDDVYYARIGPAVFDMLDVDRIEVLRGPQGTLFGRNTTAGAISITSKKPTFDTEGFAELGAGDYNLWQARGSLSGGIIPDKLAGRISFAVSSRGGFMYDTNQLRRIHNLDNMNVRGQLLFTPTDALNIRLIGDYAKQSTLCCVAVTTGYQTSFDNGAAIPNTYAQRVAQLGYTPLPIDPSARLTDADRQRPYKSSQGGGSVNIDWDLGSVTLTSISAYRFWNSAPRNDSDYSALQIIVENNQDDHQRQWSQEFRIASNGKRTIDYVAGLYYFHQTYPGLLRSEYGRDAGLYYIAPGTSGLTDAQRAEVLNGAYSTATSVAKTDSFAAFGQSTWHITSGLSLTGGLRYTYELKSGNYQSVKGSRIDLSNFTAAELAVRAGYTPVVPYYELKHNWGNVSGQATLAEQISADANVYATYSHGAKSGGLNFANLPKDANGQTLTGLAIVSPERVDNYEIGIKTQWFDRKLTANLALYRTDVTNYQSNIVDTTVTPNRIYISNVGDVRSQGIELDVRANPFAGFSVYASGSYNDAKYRSYTNAQCPFEDRAPGQPTVCDLSGSQLPAASKYGATAGGEYSFALRHGIDAIVGGDYSYRSSYFTTFNDSRYSKVASAGLVNARIGLKSQDGRWEGTVWSRNLLNKTYFYTQSIEETGGRLIGFLSDPRTWGVVVKHTF